MEPLSLRVRPPRSPHERLDGLLFLPRTIDKARASLPGGDLGAYLLAGLSEMLLHTIEVDPRRFIATVGRANDEKEVAQWLRGHADTLRYEAWNEWLLSRRIIDEAHRAQVVRRYPVLFRRPNLSLIVDILEADDKLAFAPLALART